VTEREQTSRNARGVRTHRAFETVAIDTNVEGSLALRRHAEAAVGQLEKRPVPAVREMFP
jgi:hypothetical protein